MKKIVIGIAHAAWLPERKGTLHRLLRQLAECSSLMHTRELNVHVSVSNEREHASVWARRLWAWAAEHDAHAVLLNDDVEVCPDFVDVVRHMIEAKPDHVLSLHASPPASHPIEDTWFRSYWLTGPGYVLPPGVARWLLEWSETIPKAMLESINEDNLAIHWAWEQQRPMYCSVPAIVKHDTSVKSSLGYDDHPLRVASLLWDDPRVELHKTDWTVGTDPFAPNPWMSEGYMRIVDRKLRSFRARRAPLERVTFSITYTHDISKRERRSSLLRLLEQLEANDGANVKSSRVESTPGPWWVWSELQWSKAAELDVDASIFLQDDVDASPDFWTIVDAMVRGRPDDIIALSCAHPAARTIFTQGKPGYTTTDGLIGIGYIFPQAVLREFLEWRRTELAKHALERLVDDALVNVFAMATGRTVFHPVPTVIDHDLELASTNTIEKDGRRTDDGAYRRPQVTWRDWDRLPEAIRGDRFDEHIYDPSWWAQEVPHLGRFYEGMNKYLPLFLKDTEGAAQIAAELEVDKCPKKYLRFFPAVNP
jgi:hypothetical protein